MEARSVSAAHGWQWIVAGFGLFKKSPLIWVVLTLILLMLAMLLGMLAPIGQFAFYLLTPLFVAGLMQGCQELEKGEELEIAHLFAGFRQNASQQVTVGGIYLVGQVLILGVMTLIGGEDIMKIFLGGPHAVDMEAIMREPGNLFSATFVGTALSVPLVMALWFAPVLVALHQVTALGALRLSFAACLKNLGAFSIYGLVLLVLAIAAIMTFGIGLLVLVPLCITSLYAGYRDIFSAE